MGADIKDFRQRFKSLVSTELDLEDGVLDLFLAAYLSRQHVLLEGPPGTGKSSLAKCLGQMTGGFSRVQMNVDVTPVDVIGLEVLVSSQPLKMEFREGPIFSSILMVDEINRAMPKTQSALLQAMEECEVEVMGTQRALDPHFFVVATQNPYDMDGTYLLPASQLDRFGLCLSLEASRGEVLERRLAFMMNREAAAQSPSVEDWSRPELPRFEAHADWYKLAALLQDGVLELAPSAGLECRPLSLRAFKGWLEMAWALSCLEGHEHLSTSCMRKTLAPCLLHRIVGEKNDEVSDALLERFDRWTS